MGTASEENQISERADETSTSRRPHSSGMPGESPRTRPHLTTCASFPTRTIGKS